ncbi:MAG: hypothetical protein Q8O57_06685, partial [Kiritimatiellota bacterium]|nr:hypothetical protein [Kiritimatiellota bacterium]
MLRFLIILVFFAVLPALNGVAANRYWVGGDGTWNDTNHWSGAAGGAGGTNVPATGDYVYVTNSVGDIVVSYTNTANPAISNLLIQGLSGASVTITQSQDYLTVAGSACIASNAGARATFVQTGGTNIFCTNASPTTFVIAYDANATGVYHLVDGFLASAGDYGGFAV